MMDTIVERMKQERGITEQFKAEDRWRRVQKISVTSDEKFPRQSSHTELISGYLAVAVLFLFLSAFRQSPAQVDAQQK